MSNKPLFLEIIQSWPCYFENFDEGLGTTYERFILHKYFACLKEKYKIESVLEAPSFGMTGVSGLNSLWWSANGIIPTVLDDHPDRLEQIKKVWNELTLSVSLHQVEDFSHLHFADNSFDLSWNFAALWFIKDLTAFFKELDRITKKVIFICMPNHYGIGYQIREWFFDKAQDNFYPDHIRPKVFVPLLKALDWKIVQTGYFDIPPWPDIAMKKEDLLKKLGLGFLLRKQGNSSELHRPLCILDYFNGKNPEMERDILKYAFLEKVPFPVKQLWSHHRYFIFERNK